MATRPEQRSKSLWKFKCLNVTIDQSNVLSDKTKDQLIGDHETQESEGGEADLHKYLVGCMKNPGHKQFIAVDTFTLKHLPEGLQNNYLYEYIKCMADLTVRISVCMASPDRPKFWPKTTQPYPFYNKKKQKKNLRTGSGRVCSVNRFEYSVRQDARFGYTAYTKCCCRKCEDSDSPSNVWWEFNVYTATHVVFDEVEAENTTLRLFYDRDDSPFFNVNKVSVLDVNIEYDCCRLECVTCDTNLGNKLMEIWGHFENILLKVRYTDFDTRSKQKFNFIVSHPHGCSKQISVGEWIDKHKVGDFRSKFTYSTCTCPGSSGAHVLCIGYNEGWLSNLVHSGSVLTSGLNYSGVGRVW